MTITTTTNYVCDFSGAKSDNPVGWLFVNIGLGSFNPGSSVQHAGVFCAECKAKYGTQVLVDFILKRDGVTI